MANYTKILILEDNANDATVVQRLLKKQDPHVQFKLVMTRKDYIKELNSFYPDVIISDNSLPQFNASEALTILQGFSTQIPFILVTGTVSEEFAAGIIKAGADDYILKDRMARLPAAIDAALKKKNAEAEKSQVRRKLAKSEEKYMNLFERNHAGVYQTSPDGTILSCNTSFAKMLGYMSSADLMRKNAADLYFSSHDRDNFITALRQENQITNFELVLKHKEGREVHVLENTLLFVDPDTKEEIIEGIILDISRQKKADKEKKRLSSIIECSTDFVGIADTSLHIIFINKAGRAMTGYEETENLAFTTIDTFIPKRIDRLIINGIIEDAATNGNWTGEVTILGKNGNEIPALATVIALKGENGEPEFLSIVAKNITELKKAESEREFHKNNLAALINNTYDLMWSIDKNFKLITFNNAFELAVNTITGNKVKKGDNMDYLNVAPESINRFRGFYERAFAGETFIEIDYYEEKWSEISFYPIYNNEVIIGTACYSHNITERKNAETSLKALYDEKELYADRMSTILNTLPANIALLDEQGIIIDVNNSWRSFADCNGFIGSNYGIGSNYLQVSASATEAQKEDGAIVSIGIKGVLNKLTSNFEFEYPCNGGGIARWFRMIATPLRDEERGGAVIMHIDITEQKKSAAALELTLMELSDYKIALDESSIVSITDPKGLLTYVNANFCAISKYSREELLGKDHNIVNASFHDEQFINKLWSTISHGEIWRSEMKNKDKNGGFYWVDTTIVPFLDKKGKPLQYVAINKDITEQKAIEQELLMQKVEEQRKITRAMITAQEKERHHLGEELHDNINQILAGTRLYLNSAGNTHPEVKELIKYPLELLDNSMEEIRLLCRKLVTPVKNLILDEMLGKMLTSYTDTTNISISFNFDISPDFINDDLKLNIYRIIQEQMNNIAKYANAKSVSITLSELEKAVSLVITDDGVGFDLAAGRKGIGLLNMINRVESYNGLMKITTSPGYGCSIAVKIPIA